MVMINELKESIFIIALGLYVLYGVVKIIYQYYDRRYMGYLRYSLSFLGGAIIICSTVIGLIYTFYYAFEWAIWFIVFIAMGVAIFSYGVSVLLKCKGKTIEYTEQVKNLKELIVYIVVFLIIVVLRNKELL